MVVAVPAARATLAVFLLAQAAPESKATMLADLYGGTLGAAAQCSEVDATRLEHDTASVSARLKELAPDPQAAQAAGAQLAAAVARGSRDVQTGAVTCTQAVSELANLERDLGVASP